MACDKQRSNEWAFQFAAAGRRHHLWPNPTRDAGLDSVDSRLDSGRTGSTTRKLLPSLRTTSTTTSSGNLKRLVPVGRIEIPTVDLPWVAEPGDRRGQKEGLRKSCQITRASDARHSMPLLMQLPNTLHERVTNHRIDGFTGHFANPWNRHGVGHRCI